MSWYLKVLKKYSDFDGRASRREYWIFTLIHFSIVAILATFDGLMGVFDMDMALGILSGVYVFGTFLPTLAVTTRRLHDTGLSGWWQLLNLLPLVGPFVLIALLTRASR